MLGLRRKKQILKYCTTQVSDLTPLATLTDLESLDLSRTQVIDLAPLAPLATLHTLYLGRTLVTDLAPLAALPKLKHLDLTGLPADIEAALPRRAEINVMRR